MESNHLTSSDHPEAASRGGGLPEELEALLARISEGDPAVAGEPAGALADLLGALLETEEDQR